MGKGPSACGAAGRVARKCIPGTSGTQGDGDGDAGTRECRVRGHVPSHVHAVSHMTKFDTPPTGKYSTEQNVVATGTVQAQKAIRPIYLRNPPPNLTISILPCIIVVVCYVPPRNGTYGPEQFLFLTRTRAEGHY